jgi:phosphoglycerate dehydrogenase-like enzyme
VNAFPAKDSLTVHFAHTAYQLAAAFERRGTGIDHFQSWTPAETARRIADGDVLVLSGFWDNAFLGQAPQLRFIQGCAAGYNQFDQQALAEHGVRLCNASGVNANAVSDHAMALILSLHRQLHLSRDNQRDKFWRPMISEISKRQEELSGKTLLIVGMGTIGQKLAKRAQAFDMRVVGVRRNVAAIEGQVDAAHPPADLPKLWAEADVVALTCALTPETTNIVGAEAFAALPDHAYVINVSRGACIDEPALVDALQSGAIAGAGIDTTWEEPLDAASPLWEMANVVLTPHTAGETRVYEERVIDILLENLDRMWRGETDLVNQIV